VPRKMTVDRLSCKVVRCFELRHCAARLHRTQAKLRWPLQQASGARFLLGTRRHSNHRLRVSISSIMRGMGARSMACVYASSRRGARAPSSVMFPPSPGLYVDAGVDMRMIYCLSFILASLDAWRRTGRREGVHQAVCAWHPGP
jgi:hypothetical protein